MSSVCLCAEGCENRLVVVVERSPYSSVVEHPLSKRKVGSSILPGGNVDAHMPTTLDLGAPTPALLLERVTTTVAYLRIRQSASHRFRPTHFSIRAISRVVDRSVSSGV